MLEDTALCLIELIPVMSKGAFPKGVTQVYLSTMPGLLGKTFSILSKPIGLHTDYTQKGGAYWIELEVQIIDSL